MGAVSGIFGASRPLTDAKASLSGPLLPRNPDTGFYGYHMLNSIHWVSSGLSPSFPESDMLYLALRKGGSVLGAGGGFCLGFFMALRISPILTAIGETVERQTIRRLRL